MKLLTSHSSSSPSSSSSSLSFDPAMCHSKKATAGCLTGILRRILCSGGLPTHPSDQIRETDSIMKDEDQELKKAKHKVEAATTLSTPGIVARLMGLESMVKVPTESAATSLSRSRSMNSVDYFGESNRLQGMHRRVKSTLSFRELPTFLLLESENFLVLSFESGGKSKEFKSKGRDKEMGSAELKQKRVERRKFKENKREKVSSENILNGKENLSKKVGKLQEVTNTLPLFNVPSEKKHTDSEAVKFSRPINFGEAQNGGKLKRRKKKRSCRTEKKLEIECNSEDSSPVSVLDFERQVPGSEVDSLATSLSSRRKLSPELENDQHFLLRFDGNLMIEQRKMKAIEGQKYEGSKRIEKHRKEYIDIWDEVCRLAEDELVGSNQIQEGMWKQGDCESISADFGSEIFDCLLNELIHQLV